MQGKVVIVTGGFGALGGAVARYARSLGARVAMLDVAPAPASLKDDQLAIGGVDLSNLEATKAAVQRVRDAAGRVDALLNIAGGFTWVTIGDDDGAAWDKMYAVNVKTALNASKAALPHLVESGGAIVNIGANGAVKAATGMAPYAASKQGVHKLTESLAEEMKGKVRVNAVLPSIIDTPTNRKDMPDADFASWVRPDELAKVILFLASDDASGVTGALVLVTGRV